jgi:hypothetical protein
MTPLVVVPVSTCRKLGLAVLAAVRLFSSVLPNVHLEVTLLEKLQAAERAYEEAC